MTGGLQDASLCGGDPEVPYVRAALATTGEPVYRTKNTELPGHVLHRSPSVRGDGSGRTGRGRAERETAWEGEEGNGNKGKGC